MSKRVKFIMLVQSITVEPVLFLYMFVTFTNFVTVQALVYEKSCILNFNSTVCDNLKNKTFQNEEDSVQKMTSRWLMYINLAMGIPSLIMVGLFLGPWGDKVGRKIPVIFPLIGQILAGISNTINAHFLTASIGYMLIGGFLNGLFGGYIAALMANYSYIAHVSSPENKTVKIGILEAMIFLSGTIGTALSGVMLDNTSYVFVFIFITSVVVVSLLYTLIRVENIKPERTESSEDAPGCCQGLILGAIKDILHCVYDKRKSKEFPILVVLMAVIFLVMLNTVGENDIILIFTRHPPLSWSQTTLGLFKGTETFLRGMAVLVFLPICKWKLKLRDTTLAIIGLISRTIEFIIMGVGRSTSVFFLAAVTGLLQGFTSAGIRSMSSSLVDLTEQAKVFSMMAIFESLAALAATGLYNNLYNATLEFYSGFCFLVAAGIILLCTGIMSVLHFKLPRQLMYRTLSEEIQTENGNIQSDDGSLQDEA